MRIQKLTSVACCVMSVVLLLGAVARCRAVDFAIYPTGVDNSFNPLPGGSSDPHYSLGLDWSRYPLNPTYPWPYPGDPSTPPTFAPAVVQSSLWGDWVTTPSTGKWIAAVDDPYNFTYGWYTIRTSFDLTGLDPSTANITGQWTCDNPGEIFLNGHDTGISLTANGGNPFQSLYPLSINSGFQNGVNELEFHVLFWD